MGGDIAADLCDCDDGNEIRYAMTMMKTKLYRRAWLALCVFLFAQATRLDAAIDIQFDLTYDSNSFFVGHADRVSILNTAASRFEDRLTDTLLGIQPGAAGGNAGNTWTAIVDNPSTGVDLNLTDMTIGQNVVVVFVGARQLGTSTLGIGGPGGFSASGTQSFLNTVAARGQSGALQQTATDFGPWGGALTFDVDANWYFGTGSMSGKSDFFSVVLHELGHLLGIGTAESWDNQITGSQFTGPKATQANGGLRASISADGGHWAEGTTSTVFGTSTMQEAAMDPTILVGTRKDFTTLDYAGLGDIGWQVVPEPSTFALLALAGVFIAARCLSWQKAMKKLRVC